MAEESYAVEEELASVDQVQPRWVLEEKENRLSPAPHSPSMAKNIPRRAMRYRLSSS